MSPGVSSNKPLTVWTNGVIPDADELVYVPRDAPEAMWDGLPRAIMLWMDFGRSTPRTLFAHLNASGYEVPAWMLEEGELKALDHVPSKGTRCVLIYRAMVENWLASADGRRMAETENTGSVPQGTTSAVANGETRTPSSAQPGDA